MEIRVDDVRGPEIAALLEAHLENSRRWSPPGSIHALDLAALRVPEITLWTLWEAGALCGCAALKELSKTTGEIKSMHTAIERRGRGVAERLLRHIIAESTLRAYAHLYLETGSMDAYRPARSLYQKLGFVPCDPFGGYSLDPHSAFMHLALANPPRPPR